MLQSLQVFSETKVRDGITRVARSIFVVRHSRTGRLLLALLIGTLLGAGFVVPGAWILVFLGVPAFLYTAQFCSSRWSVLWFGWSAATVSAAWSVVWFWSVIPIEWLSVGSIVEQKLLVAIYWVIVSLWLGAGGGFIALVWYWWWNRAGYRFWYVVAPITWLSGEVMGSLIFSLATWRPEILIAPQFSFGYVGYAFAQHDLLFFAASVAGVYSVTVVGVMLSVWLWQCVYQKRTTWVCVGVTTLLLTMWLPDLPVSQSDSTVVAVVDTDVAPTVDARQGVQPSLKEAVATAGQVGASYVVLPEDARFFMPHLDSLWERAQLQKSLTEYDFTLIDSARHEITDSNSIIRGAVYDTKDGFVARADKQFLVPQGEFTPVFFAGVLSLFGYGSELEEMMQGRNYIPGPRRAQVFPDTTPRILFCFEGVTPWGVRRLLSTAETTVPFIAHPVSHAWFHDPETLWRQLDTMLRVQAFWNDIPVVSAGNQAPGKVYLPNGTIQNTAYKTIPVGDRVTVRLFRL
jgi:apolipoprotein N-acyltransferase